MIHRAMAAQISRIVKDMGADLRLEMPIIEFGALASPTPQDGEDDDFDHDPIEAKNSVDAVMDVVAFCPNGAEFLVDVSVRNPLTNRYLRYACSKPGYVAGRASMINSIGTLHQEANA